LLTDASSWETLVVKRGQRDYSRMSAGIRRSGRGERLATGERDAVLEYLALCERFWVHRADALRHWRSEIDFAVLGSQP